MSKIHDVTGQRIGQLIYNSITYNYLSLESTSLNIHAAQTLFYIEDENLIKLVKEYLAKES